LRYNRIGTCTPRLSDHKGSVNPIQAGGLSNVVLRIRGTTQETS